MLTPCSCPPFACSTTKSSPTATRPVSASVRLRPLPHDRENGDPLSRARKKSALTANLRRTGDWAFGTDKKYHAYRAQQKQQKAALAAKKSS
jgi:hypothetical protein